MAEGMKYVTVIKKNGELMQQVVDRGQSLCSNIYVVANRIGKITNDEHLPDADEVPVYETGHVGGGGE